MYVKAFPLAPDNTSRLFSVPNEIRYGKVFVKMDAKLSDVEEAMGFGPGSIERVHIDESTEADLSERRDEAAHGATHRGVKFAWWHGDSCIEAVIVQSYNSEIYILGDNGKTIDRVR